MDNADKTVTYGALVSTYAEWWLGSSFDDFTDNQIFRNQIYSLAVAFPDIEEERVGNDILDAAGIYRAIQWDGVRTPIIESGSNVWVQDDKGVAFDFGGDGEGFRELVSGVLVSHTAIQADDNAGWSEHFTDLHAARIAAGRVSHLTGRPHTVWFNGSY